MTKAPSGQCLFIALGVVAKALVSRGTTTPSNPYAYWSGKERYGSEKLSGLYLPQCAVRPLSVLSSKLQRDSRQDFDSNLYKNTQE